MISGRDFVVLSDDYFGLPTSAIHLFRRLARQNRVFWFNTIGRFPRWTRPDVRKVLRTMGAWVGSKPGKDRVALSENNVQVVTPVMLPWFKPWGRRFNRRSLLRKYRKLCARHPIANPIVVTTFPHGVDFIEAVPAALKIYYCVDDFLHYPGINSSDWAKMEAELLETVDGLVVTSRLLAQKRRNGCPLLHLPHGVDFEHFTSGRDTWETEATLETLPRPIVGFFGLVSRWFDQDLLAHLSDNFPQVSFVLIGRAEVDLGALVQRPNVHYLGFLSYEELPRYARYLQIGLIPYLRTPFTRAINPLKLLEYFALGLPVLATRLPALADAEGPVRLAESKAEFADGLRALLSEDLKGRAQAAVELARRNTWDVRVEQLSAFLEQVITEAPSCVR
jgi:glycosyltransferase involved in cell wall biosynthesis